MTRKDLYRVGLLAGAWLAATPAHAYHEGTLGERVGYCAMQAFALVEVLQTQRESLSATHVGLAGVAPAEAARAFDLVQRSTAAGVTRLSTDLKGCFDAVERDARVDGDANVGATMLETEVKLAETEVGKLRDQIYDMEVTLRGQWGPNAAAQAAAALQALPLDRGGGARRRRRVPAARAGAGGAHERALAVEPQ